MKTTHWSLFDNPALLTEVMQKYNISPERMEQIKQELHNAEEQLIELIEQQNETKLN